MACTGSVYMKRTVVYATKCRCSTSNCTHIDQQIREVPFRSPFLFSLLAAGVEVVYFHLITLRHTPQSVGLLWTKDRAVAETSTRQHKHCTRDINIHAPVGFEPTIPASARPHPYALRPRCHGDRPNTGSRVEIGLRRE
jgi:hypothetical protein